MQTFLISHQSSKLMVVKNNSYLLKVIPITSSMKSHLASIQMSPTTVLRQTMGHNPIIADCSPPHPETHRSSESSDNCFCP